MVKTYDVTIIGCGPAGLSAALYVRRAGLSCAVIGKDGGALTKADKIENYFGVGTLSGSELVEKGITQALSLGADVCREEVFSISWEDKYTVSCAKNEYQSHAVIISTGSARRSVNLPGIKEFEGKGVSYCAVCDAFFYRGKDVAVLGSGAYALHEMGALSGVAENIILLTNGAAPEVEFGKEVKIIETPIDSLYGESRLSGVRFTDKTSLDISGLFIALGSAAAGDLAKKVGAPVNGSAIVVDDSMSTGLPGLYAAGDCTGGLLQVSVAVGEGAKAAMSAIKYVKSLKKRED